MKIKIQSNWKEVPPNGYTLYSLDCLRPVKKYCRWWAYPIFAFGMFLIRKKLHLYHFLNDVRIMHTPWGCRMRLKDIWDPFN